MKTEVLDFQKVLIKSGASVRLLNVCYNLQIDSPEGLAAMTKEEFVKHKNIGRKTCNEAAKFLDERGFTFYPTKEEMRVECRRLIKPSVVSERHIKALELKLSGKTYKDVGKAFGISSSRARQLVQRCCRSLRRNLSVYGDKENDKEG